MQCASWYFCLVPATTQKASALGLWHVGAPDRKQSKGRMTHVNLESVPSSLSLQLSHWKSRCRTVLSWPIIRLTGCRVWLA